jgi:DNA-binding GntR family transcriptional regulator
VTVAIRPAVCCRVFPDLDRFTPPGGETDTTVQDDLQSILTPPASRSLGDDIASRLRAAILAGHFEPGERLGEERLARLMNVSRGPIREALALLEREGLVVSQRNKGAFVAQLSSQDLDELYTLRRAIETLALELAVDRATDTDLAALGAVIDRIAAETRDGISEQAAAELDLQFHDHLYEAAHHRRLWETWQTIRPQIHILLLNRNVADDDFRAMAVDAHALILDAIRQRDRDRAVAVLHDHLAGSYERVRRSYERRANGSGGTR